MSLSSDRTQTSDSSLTALAAAGTGRFPIVRTTATDRPCPVAHMIRPWLCGPLETLPGLGEVVYVGYIAAGPLDGVGDGTG